MPDSIVLPAGLHAALHPWSPSEGDAWDLRKAAHLYRRAGFGGSLPELNRALEQGHAATLDWIVAPPDGSQPLDDLLKLVRTELVQFDDDLIEPQSFWFYRMIASDRPLEEKMALFWHDHFATANYKVNSPTLMYRQYETMRKAGLDRFEDLLLAMARDPAMIIWLDNNSNRKGQPNENFAREILELFTLGEGQYTEQDIKEAARAFTGWHLAGGSFRFNAGQHDGGEKTFLGETGTLGGEDVIRLLAASPKTARFLAAKLLRFFAMPEPPDALTESLAQVYLANDGRMSAVMGVLLRSRLFFGPDTYRSLIRSPVELVVSTVRLLDANSNRTMTFPALAKMGQELFNPPNVAGWPGGEAWLNDVTMLERMNFLNDMLMRSPVKVDGRDHLVLQALKDAGLSTPEETVGFLIRWVIQDDLSPAQRETLVTYFASELKKVDAPGNQESVDFKYRRVAYMLMTLPAYQLA